MIVTAVPRDALGIVWGDVVRVLNKSVGTSGGKYHIDDIYRDIDSDQVGLWLVLDKKDVVAAFTTRIIPYPGRRAMALDWVGGSRMAEWLPMVLETIEKYAKESWCQHLEGYGRKAWGRYLEKYGWKPEYIAYRMELNNG